MKMPIKKVIPNTKYDALAYLILLLVLVPITSNLASNRSLVASESIGRVVGPIGEKITHSNETDSQSSSSHSHDLAQLMNKNTNNTNTITNSSTSTSTSRRLHPNSSSNGTQEEAQSTKANENQLEMTMMNNQQDHLPLYMRILATLACLVIFVVGVAGNLLVPLVVMKTKYLRNSTNLFLINLSVADLLVLLVCMPTVFIELHSRPETWLLGESMCKYQLSSVYRVRYAHLHASSLLP